MESCAESPLPGPKKNPYHHCLHLEKRNWDVQVLTLSGLWRWARHTRRLFAATLRLLPLLNEQLGRGSVFVIKGFEVGGGGCFNDHIEASFQGPFHQKASGGCVLCHRLEARSGCCECSQVCRSRHVSRSFVSNSELACAECGSHQAVLVNPGKSLSRDLCPSS